MQIASTVGVTTSTQTMAAAEGVATASTTGLSAAAKSTSGAFKGLGMSLKGFLTSPTGKITAIIAGILLLSKLIDTCVVTAKEAKEEIDSSRQEYEDIKSSIASMNDELDNTKSRIEELQSKGKLTFTEEAELENLKKQNDELEKSIVLEEKKAQKKASKVVGKIRDNSDTLIDDFSTDLNHYNDYKKALEDDKKNGEKYVADGSVSVENYEETIQQEEDALDEFQNTMLDHIEEFEKDKQSLIDKYGNTDVKKWTSGDQELYTQLTQQLDKAYKSVYSNAEYNKFVVEPVFNTDKLQGLQEQLATYFSTGGSRNTDALSSAFGNDIISALQVACYNAGVDFDKMITDLYNNSTKKLNEIAPTIKNPSGQTDAIQNQEAKKKRDYFSSLDEADQTLLLNAEIPDSVKNGTTDDLKKFLADLQKDANENQIEVTVTTASDSLTKMADDVKNLSSAYGEFKDGGFVNVDTFNGMSDAMKGLESYDSFVTVAGDVKSSAGDIQKSFDDLMTEYIYTSDAMKGLTTETQGLYETQLKAQGITNASEICTSNYAQALIFANEKGIDLSNATWQEIQALANEQGMTEVTRQTMAALAVEKFNVSHQGVYNANDIQDLYNLAQQAGATKEELNSLAKAKASVAGSVPGMTSKASEAIVNNAVNGVTEDLKKDAKYKPLAKYDTRSGASGGSSGGGSKGSSASTTKKTKEYIDNIATALTKLKDVASSAKDKISDLLSFDAKKNQAQSAIKANTKAINAEEKAAQKYEAFAKKIAKSDVKGKNGVSQKTLAKYEKLVREGSLDKNAISTIKNEKLKTAISDYQSWYDKAKSCREEIASLNETTKDLYETLANNPIDKASDNIDKLSKKMSLAEAKLANATDLGTYKSLSQSKISNISSQTNENKIAMDTANANLESANAKIGTTSTSVTKALDTKKERKKSGLNSKEIASLRSSMKSGKLISDKILNSISNNALFKKCQAYNESVIAQEQYSLASESAGETYELSVEENAKQQRAIQKDIFDKTQQSFERQLAVQSAQENVLSNQIDLLEAKGATVSAQYYKDSISQEQTKLATYEQEKAQLQQQIANIQAGTDEWYDAQSAIYDVDDAIASCNLNIVNMNNNINDLADTIHDKLLATIQSASDEMDFFASLISSKKMTDDDTGNLTNEGLFTLGSYTFGMNDQFVKAEQTKKLLEEMKANYDKDIYSYVNLEGNERNFQSPEAMKEKIDELYSDWREQIQATNEYEQKAIDLISEKYNAELDYLKKLIDEKKNALQVEKDLYNYQKSISDKTKNINTIQKQITAISGDKSEEGMSKTQQLQAKLEEAQTDLKDTQYDKMISMQEDMLDNLYSEYEELMNDLLNNTDVLIQDAIDATNNNTSAINDMKTELAEKYGYTEQYTKDVSDGTKDMVVDIKSIKDAFDLSQSGVYGVSINSGIASIIGLLRVIGSKNSTDSSPVSNVSVQTPPSVPTPTPTDVQALSDSMSKSFNNNMDNVQAEADKQWLTASKKNIEDIFKDKTCYVAGKKKNSSDYSTDINKYLFLNSGKVLSSSGLTRLCAILGCNADDLFKQLVAFKDNLTRYNIDPNILNVAGFASGGIARQLQGKIRSNGDSLLASVNPNETILTSDFTKMLPETVGVMKQFNDIKVPDYSGLASNKSVSTVDIGDVQIVLDGSKVVDEDSFISALDKPRVKKAVQSVTTDMLTTKGTKLGINKYK